MKRCEPGWGDRIRHREACQPSDMASCPSDEDGAALEIVESQPIPRRVMPVTGCISMIVWLVAHWAREHRAVGPREIEITDSQQQVSCKDRR